MLTDEVFDCVVSDYDLPGQNGIVFLRTVREQFPDLPFILYTGKGSEEVAMEAISAGVTDYLQKESGTDQYTVLANRITNAVESHRSEQKLAEQNRDLQRYKQMINSMNEAACIYDESGRFVVVNEYLANWYNTTKEQLKGQKSRLIPIIRDQSADSDPYQALLDGRREQLSGEVEVEFSHRGDVVLEYRLVRLTVDGVLEGIVGVARDITEHKDRERKLRRERDRLDEFAGVVSHDIQNPLTVAKGRLEPKGECDSDHLAGLGTALDRITRITEDVLWLAREGRAIGAVDAVMVAHTIQSFGTLSESRQSTPSYTTQTRRFPHSLLKQTMIDCANSSKTCSETRLNTVEQTQRSQSVRWTMASISKTMGLVSPKRDVLTCLAPATQPTRKERDSG